MEGYIGFSIAGTQYYRAPHLRAAKTLVPGMTLKLEHERNNPHDSNAVAVRLQAAGEMLGHVPRERAEECVQLIRSGKLLSAVISKVQTRNEKINISVALTIYRDPREVRAPLYRPPKPPDYRFMPYGGVFYEPSKTTKLTKLFGNAIGDLRDAFLSLSNDALELFLGDYAAAHGESKANYVRKTYPGWKYGRVKLSGQTMERLLELLPGRLPPDVRLSLLRSVLAKNPKTVPTRKIEIDRRNPDAGFREFESALASMSHRDVLAYLPEHIMKAATFLYEDDITVARAMLAQAERQETDVLRAKAAADIAVLRNLIARRALNQATHRIELPTGVLDIAVIERGLLSRVASLVGVGGSRR